MNFRTFTQAHLSAHFIQLHRGGRLCFPSPPKKPTTMKVNGSNNDSNIKSSPHVQPFPPNVRLPMAHMTAAIPCAMCVTHYFIFIHTPTHYPPPPLSPTDDAPYAHHTLLEAAQVCASTATCRMHTITTAITRTVAMMAPLLLEGEHFSPAFLHSPPLPPSLFFIFSPVLVNLLLYI